jgi:hypothetical protein
MLKTSTLDLKHGERHVMFKMLIKTITCHDVYNHGAALQAYALMQYLQKQGHDAQIIDYKPKYLSGYYKLSSINHPAWNTNFIKRAIYLIVKFPGRIMPLRRKCAFDRFTEKYLKLTPIRYLSNEQIKENLPIADAYICGSDQIWNCLFPNGKDPAFYLDFVPKNKKKMSYAASFAIENIPKEYKQDVKEKIDKLDYISVRESSGIRILENLGIHRGVQVLDPVFLLDRGEWDSLCTHQEKDKYLLVYDFDRNDLIKRAAIQISREKNLKIYSIDHYKCKYANKSFPFAGPEVFVSLIKNAEFIISNSFHGTAFSILFEKSFFVINRNEKLNTRMIDLLASLGIERRLIAKEIDIKHMNSDIDYDAVNKKLSDLKLQSKQFLNNITKEKIP